MAITRIKDGNASGSGGTYLRYVNSLDTSALPTTPDSPPVDSNIGDVIIQYHSNEYSTNIRAVIRWVYNGTIWEQVGEIEYNNLHILDEVAGNLDYGSPPTSPANHTGNESITYLPLDTLREEYDNGYVEWVCDGSTWTFKFMRLRGNNATSIYHYTTFDTSAVPTAPTTSPSQPSLNDTIVENFDNDAGNERVTMIWKYNGTTWVALGHPEYHPMHFFDIVGSNVNVGSPPLTPANFGTDVETTYIPGDTVWEDYNDGFIYWQIDSGGLWQIGSMVVYPAGGGGGGSDGKATLGVVSSFDNAAVPTAPTVPPSSPTTGDVYIETFNNTTGNQRVIMRWTYNGTIWVLNGVPEYNIRNFHAVVGSSFNILSLPATPDTPGSSTGYITGDTLREEYNNGYIDWVYATSSWTLRHARIAVGVNNKTTLSHQTTFNTSSVPTTPVSPAGSPITGDVHIETFDNTTGDSRVVQRWTYNGSAWVLTTDTEYNIRNFSVSVGSNLNPSSLPATPNTPGAATDYIPGDTLHEEYNNGYMRWVYTLSGWTVSLGRVYTTNNLVTLGTVSSFNMNSVPTTPSSPPSGAKSGDVYIESYNNTNQNQKVIIRWTYNGTTWVINGTPEYNLKRYFATVASNLTAGALPSTPATPGSSTGYVTGDTLLETYNNGHLEWTYGTSSWTLSASRINTNRVSIIKGTGNWDEDGTLPTTPDSAPSSPLINDIIIQSYDNTTRNNAVTRYWSYNGSAWVELTNGIHRFNMVFTNTPGTALTYGVAPTAALAATTTSYVNGDILWEKYTNGYGLYKFNNGTWTLEVSGLEVGRIQDSADFQATLGPGVDGYYIVYDHSLTKFTLSAT